MTEAQIIKIKSAPKQKPAAAPKKRSRYAARALSRQTLSTTGIGLVAIVATFLSLNHLAHGIQIVTHCDDWQAYAMAIIIDLGFIMAEATKLTVVTDKLRAKVTRWANMVIWGALSGSAAMNAFAFAERADGYLMIGTACLMGAAIPGMIYCLTQIGGLLASDCHAKA